MNELAEDASEVVVNRILRKYTKENYLHGWVRERSWKKLLFDMTKRRFIITGGKRQVEFGGSIICNNHSMNMSSNAFLPLQNLVPPRQDFHLEWLSGNLFLISNSDVTDSGEDDIVRIEKYNYVTNVWQDLTPLNCKLKCATTAVINNQIWILGGFNMDIRERSSDIHILRCHDDSTVTWGLSPIRLSKSRSKHAAVVYKEELYIAGGYNGDFYYDSVEIFNFASGQWREGPAMTKVRRLFHMVVADGAIYAVGGDVGRTNSIERLDFASNSWSLMVDVKDCRKFGCVTAFESKIFLFGGRDNLGKALDSWDSFDVLTEKWHSDDASSAERALPREHLFNGQAILIPSSVVTW